MFLEPCTLHLVLMNPGLYIHIPFCISKCNYCNFYSVTSLDLISDFLESLFKEMEMYHGQFEVFDTLYIGGGTPSVLRIKQIEELLKRAKDNFSLSPDSEITIEVNPGDLNPTYLESLLDTGINRINIGVQSFDNAVLSFIGRRHSDKKAFSALEMSRDAGFDNVGLDLIYGLPGQNMDGWMQTLEQALSFNPEHLSCYELTVEPETPLAASCRNDDIILPDEELQYNFFMKTSEKLEEAGYIHYEVSNFARGMTYASSHNQKYWNHTPYLGLGPSAHSFLHTKRWWNHRFLFTYISSIKRGTHPVEDVEYLRKDQLFLETLYLGLRTKKGINLCDFKRKYDYDLLIEKKEIIMKLIDEEFINIKDGYIYPSRRGLAMADSLSLV